MLEKDKADHSYIEIENIRLTYIPVADRSQNKDWAGSDVMRIQAYKGDGKSLHMGAEIPISSPEVMIDLIAALCQLYNSSNRED
jgi:hypothetical protein